MLSPHHPVTRFPADILFILADGVLPFQQDMDPKIRMLRIRRLPPTLLKGIERHYVSQPSFASCSSDEAAFWLKVASDESFVDVLQQGATTLSAPDAEYFV